jgi:hypothetical protein
MGFWHEWKFAKKYTPDDWAAIAEEAQALCDALPEVARKRVLDHLRAGFWGVVSMSMEMLGPRKSPVRGKFDAGNISGIDGEGVECLGFLPSMDGLGGALEAVISNKTNVSCAKTGAELYDHVVVGVLCLCEEARPGNVKIQSTDGESDYWEEIADWASKVVGRDLPMPKAIRGSAKRLAAMEARALESAVPTAAKAGAKKRM